MPHRDGAAPGNRRGADRRRADRQGAACGGRTVAAAQLSLGRRAQVSEGIGSEMKRSPRKLPPGGAAGTPVTILRGATT
ncbi:protein of unknown function [Burkholderia multivorans]